ncbi:MAG: hypothetical protein AVDCRST_MAG67-2877, partial [uncultured Solirubrobacteraceae bacterium]
CPARSSHRRRPLTSPIRNSPRSRSVLLRSAFRHGGSPPPSACHPRRRRPSTSAPGG